MTNRSALLGRVEVGRGRRHAGGCRRHPHGTVGEDAADHYLVVAVVRRRRCFVAVVVGGSACGAKAQLVERVAELGGGRRDLGRGAKL